MARFPGRWRCGSGRPRLRLCRAWRHAGGEFRRRPAERCCSPRRSWRLASSHGSNLAASALSYALLGKLGASKTGDWGASPGRLQRLFRDARRRAVRRGLRQGGAGRRRVDDVDGPVDGALADGFSACAGLRDSGLLGSRDAPGLRPAAGLAGGRRGRIRLRLFLGRRRRWRSVSWRLAGGRCGLARRGPRSARARVRAGGETGGGLSQLARAARAVVSRSARRRRRRRDSGDRRALRLGDRHDLRAAISIATISSRKRSDADQKMFGRIGVGFTHAFRAARRDLCAAGPDPVRRPRAPLRAPTPAGGPRRHAGCAG